MSALLWLLLCAKPIAPLVEVKKYVPDMAVDLRYATKNNFMKKRVYPTHARCLLLKKSALMLARAAKELRTHGFRLKAYDCYRPHSIQWELWKIAPIPGYVANPKTGSNHNRGGAIDVTLVQRNGAAVSMPSDYDFFGKAAHHSFQGSSAPARKHRDILRKAMESAGFKKNAMEWWHYDLPDAGEYPLRDEPFTRNTKTADK